MRIIDADELKEHVWRDKLDNRELIVKMIDNAPTIKEIPTKTGHWKHFFAGDDCSECGWSTGKYISPSKYCPDCGAKMEDDNG